MDGNLICVLLQVVLPFVLGAGLLLAVVALWSESHRDRLDRASKRMDRERESRR